MRATHIQYATDNACAMEISKREREIKKEAKLQDSYAPRDTGILYQDAIPRHPGDYRDAYDRGLMPNLGGTSQKPSRVHFQ